MEFVFNLKGVKTKTKLSDEVIQALDDRIKSIYSNEKNNVKGGLYIPIKTKSGAEIYYTKVGAPIANIAEDDSKPVSSTVLSVIFLTKNAKRKELFEEITERTYKKYAKKFVVSTDGMTIELQEPIMVNRDEEGPGGDDSPHKTWAEFFDFMHKLYGEKDQIWAKTFCHHGVIFQTYTPHGVPFIYKTSDGNKIKFRYEEGKQGGHYLSANEERAMSLFAIRMAREEVNAEERVKNPRIQQITPLATLPVAQENFFNDLRKYYLSDEHKEVIKKFSRMDFSKVVDHFKEEIYARKNRQAIKKDKKDDKKLKRIRAEDRKNKEEKTLLNDYYGWTVVDGYKQAFTNYTVEPPTIFEGRANNPKKGHIKEFYTPASMTLNLDRNCEIPEPPDPASTEVPRAPGNIPWGGVVHNNHVEWITRYHDPITGSTKNQRLKRTGMIKSYKDFLKFEKARKLHTIIDSLRSKNNKNLKSSDDAAKKLATIVWLIDKTAMRVGGEKDDDDSDTVGATTLRVEHIKFLDDNQIKLDFLGKDGVPFEKKINLKDADPEYGSTAYKNLVSFTKGAKKTDELFSGIASDDVNAYLKKISGMNELTAKVFRTHHASLTFQEQLDKVRPKDDDDAKIIAYEQANSSVAKLCNHKKGVGVAAKKDKEAMKKLLDELEELQKKRKKAKKDGKSVATIDKSIKAKKVAIAKKEANTDYACGTSKQNYLDPRITVSYVRRNFPTEDGSINKILSKFFSPQLQRDFAWAIEMGDEDFHFDPNAPKSKKAKHKSKKVESDSEDDSKKKKSKSEDELKKKKSKKVESESEDEPPKEKKKKSKKVESESDDEPKKKQGNKKRASDVSSDW